MSRILHSFTGYKILRRRLQGAHSCPRKVVIGKFVTGKMYFYPWVLGKILWRYNPYVNKRISVAFSSYLYCLPLSFMKGTTLPE